MALSLSKSSTGHGLSVVFVTSTGRSDEPCCSGYRCIRHSYVLSDISVLVVSRSVTALCLPQTLVEHIHSDFIP